MRAVVQRVKQSSVKAGNEMVGQIGRGLLVLLGVARDDTADDADYMVNKGLSVGYASAVEVAESRQGDCTEYAVLSAALCRAVGIPSRVVMGIAYIEKYMEMENRFGGHAWTEAYVGDKWVGIDAAFKEGQFLERERQKVRRRFVKGTRVRCLISRLQMYV